MPQTPTFPRWIQDAPDHNLREVTEGLYVGAELSPGLRPAGDWSGVVDLYGTSTSPDHKFLYGGSHTVLTWPFIDGDEFPDGLLDAVQRLVQQRKPHGPILFHCQAGLSRSASCAYATMRVLEKMPHQEALRRVTISDDFPRVDTIASARKWAKKRGAQ